MNDIVDSLLISFTTVILAFAITTQLGFVTDSSMGRLVLCISSFLLAYPVLLGYSYFEDFCAALITKNHYITLK